MSRVSRYFVSAIPVFAHPILPLHPSTVYTCLYAARNDRHLATTRDAHNQNKNAKFATSIRTTTCDTYRIQFRLLEDIKEERRAGGEGGEK